MRRQLGVWSAGDLEAAGMRHRSIAELMRAGTLHRAGHGWYATSSTPAAVTTALRRGARLTCVSAAAVHGLWTPPFGKVHVAQRRGGGRRSRDVVHEHRPVVRTWPDDEPVLPLDTALVHAGTCLPGESVAVLLESALERGVLDRAAVVDILDRIPVRIRRQLTGLRIDAGSGSETRVRRYLERRGVSVRAQVQIRGVGRVDLLVGDRLIIECDSRAFHDSADAYETDRERDVRAIAAGYAVVRLTWYKIWADWQRTCETLDGLVRSGLHRARGDRLRHAVG